MAIVGRPNVGKSAIFNRLAGKRIAIVHAQSGVTRDRLIREVAWRNERFELVDTGGLCGMDGDTGQDRMETGVRSQVEAALADAAVAILTVDITAGVMPMDVEVARELRRKGIPAVVAVNKADSPERDAGAPEFEQFGFPVFAVSALHDRGFGAMMATVLEQLPTVENPTEAHPLKVAVVGRPNVGKSSYINRVLRNDRVIVSDVPGTTRDSIDIPFTVGRGEQARHYLLIDTAGMRKVGKINSSVERFSHFRAMKSIARADVVVLVLDVEQGPSSQDKRIASEIMEHEKGCVVVVNKWDLEERTQRNYAPDVSRTMPFMAHCPLVFVSAKTGFNIRRSIEVIDHVAAQTQTSIPTGILNRTVLNAHREKHPPAVKGKRLKIFYLAQVGCAPIRIRFFVNDPRRVRPAYRAYLTRVLRENFGLEGAPVVLQFRARRSKRR